MPVVVSNTSPILNLALIGQLELIRQQFGQVQIPPAVLAELRVEEETRDLAKIEKQERLKKKPLVTGAT